MVSKLFAMDRKLRFAILETDLEKNNGNLRRGGGCRLSEKVNFERKR